MGDNDVEALKTALGQLGEALAGSKFRQALKENATEAAEGRGINVAVLPEDLLSTLGAMTDDELRIVAVVQRELDTGFSGKSVAILF